MLWSIHAAPRSIHSVKQERDAKRRSKSPQVVENAGSARACATGIIDAWGVRILDRACGQERENRLKGDRGIDAGEPGGGEPPRRLSGGRCVRSRGQSCAARCRRRGRLSSSMTTRTASVPSPRSADTTKADADSGGVFGAEGTGGRRAQHAGEDACHDHLCRDRHGARIGDGRCASEASASPSRACGVGDGERGA